MKSMGTGIIYKIILYPAWVCMVLTVIMQTPVAQAAEGDSSPEMADLFRQVQALQQRVEQIRWEMGRPTAPPLHVTVKGSTIQNVYALTEVLYTKTGRLTFELTPATCAIAETEGTR